MIFKKDETITNIVTKAVRAGILVLFALAMGLIAVALFDSGSEGEASTGSFDTRPFNEGWKLNIHGNSEMIMLPYYIDNIVGDEAIITNTLPDDISDGMSLMVRASMEDVVIYVNGRLREEYSSNSVKGMSYYLPSAYVVAPLYADDAGRSVSVHITFKSRGSLNDIVIGHGNNGWFDVIKRGLPVNFIALVVFASGVVMALTARLLGRKYRMNAAGYLGLLVMDITAWMVSESLLRQLIFNRPSLSQYFSYLTLELIGAFACMYFDAVQHKQYHGRYLVAETAMLLTTLVNLILHVTHAVEMYRTVTISHVLQGLAAILIIINIITDVRNGRIHSYRISVLGGVFFILMSLVELSRFYLSEFVVFGSYMCIGLIGLMVATTVQTFFDVIGEFRAHEKHRALMTSNTIETIASAIDARDENTGGHSERVGFYAGILATEIAPEYGLSDDDILRIRYIGLIHDIGKIGVAESVLNKAGKLTDEEYSLMKRHTEIGYEMMSSLGDQIPGVIDGIRYHHERYDGKGYPDGLAGEDIPLVARILCLADSYDAMTSNRVYRKRLTSEEVRGELIRCSGSQFDPNLTDRFIMLLDRGELHENTVDGMAVNRSGEVPTSALLEDRLQKDMLNNIRIMHPSHVRMLCYIIKLMEKKGKEYSLLFVGPRRFDELTNKEISSARRIITAAITDNIRNHDVNIRYNEQFNIIALYDRSDEEKEIFEGSIRSRYEDIKTEWM